MVVFYVVKLGQSHQPLRVLKELVLAEVFVIVFVPFVHYYHELHSTHMYIYIFNYIQSSFSYLSYLGGIVATSA